MDPRKKALGDVLDLLEREGWAPPDQSSMPSATPTNQDRADRRSWVLPLICAISVISNVVLIAAYRDASVLAATAHATLALKSLEFQDSEFKSSLYLTVDGTEIWRRSPGPNASVALDFSQSKPIGFDFRCVVQLWRESRSGGKSSPELIGQSFLMADDSVRNPVEIQFNLADGSFYRWTAKVTRSPALVQNLPTPTRR